MDHIEDNYWEVYKDYSIDGGVCISSTHTEVQSPVHPDGWTDKHYNFTYNLTDEDITKGSIKLDPMFISLQWRLGTKDPSCILYHNLKTISRFSEKNSVEREIKALYNQTKRMAELYGVEL